METRLLDIYSNEMPEFISRICACGIFKRLKGIGMNCGCEYTNIPLFKEIRPYSRFDHSIGVSLIVWHFSKEIRASIAGLLHDISSPSFSHVIDFLNCDYLNQESTEDSTLGIIKGSDDLVSVLNDYGLFPEDVSDYHIYSIADNATPKLSADRLEYTLGNSINYKFATFDEVRNIYEDITVVKNEEGIDELAFTNPKIALEFARLALSCSKVYVSDQDRYAMQILSELVSNALNSGIISRADLYEPEDELIRRLCSSESAKKEWEHYIRLSGVSRSVPGMWSRKIVAKKRYINPLIKGMGRVTENNADFKTSLSEYLSWSLDYWIEGSFQ